MSHNVKEWHRVKNTKLKEEVGLCEKCYWGFGLLCELADIA
jgi:hypothetical protein